MNSLNRNTAVILILVVIGWLLTLNSPAQARPEVGRSPWGPDDELGALNRMTDASRAAAPFRPIALPLR